MGKGNLIVFVGLVGAGKTTHARLLTRWLSDKGFRSRFTFVKTMFLLTKAFSRILNRLSFRVHRLLVEIDLVLNALVILPMLTLFRIRIPLLFNDYVIVEEYLPGSIVDFVHASIVLNLSKNRIMKLIKVLLRTLYMENTLIVMVHCDTSLLPIRWLMRGSPAELSTYLRVQETILGLWLKVLGEKVTYVRTDNRSILETNRVIREALGLETSSE